MDVMRGPSSRQFPPAVVEDAQEALDRLCSFKDQATMVAQQSLKKFDGRLDLDFDQKGLMAQILAGKVALKAFQDVLKIIHR